MNGLRRCRSIRITERMITLSMKVVGPIIILFIGLFSGNFKTLTNKNMLIKIEFWFLKIR